MATSSSPLEKNSTQSSEMLFPTLSPVSSAGPVNSSSFSQRSDFVLSLYQLQPKLATTPTDSKAKHQLLHLTHFKSSARLHFIDTNSPTEVKNQSDIPILYICATGLCQTLVKNISDSLSFPATRGRKTKHSQCSDRLLHILYVCMLACMQKATAWGKSSAKASSPAAQTKVR